MLACLDLTGDETTWEHSGYGEVGSCITGCIMNKPDISKGGKIITISDAIMIRPGAYMHKHTLHEIPVD